MNEGYFNWLEKNGVKKIIENAVGPNKSKAVNVYTFDNEKNATKFKNKYLGDNEFCAVSFDNRIQRYVVSINTVAQNTLKSLYLKDLPPMTIEECTLQLDAITEATLKLGLFNKDTTTITRHGPQQITDDRIGEMALLLTNQKEGMWFSQAASAVDIAFAVYKALNYQIFTKQEIESLDRAHKALLEVDANGKVIGGLKADANFVEYIYREYGKKSDRETRRPIIRENVELILNGGDHILIDKDTPNGITSVKPKPGEPTAHQKRFFPDENGNSEIGEIVLQGGGMENHSSMRILKKERDSNVPGGYRYFYTKADAGGGAEEAKSTTGMTTGVYTTEIKPYFKLTPSSNGVNGIATYDPGNTIPISDPEEIERINQNPKLYSEYMYKTLFALLDAERQIMFYKNPNLVVDHGENKGITQDEIKEWNFWNNKITGLRGTKIAERCQESTLQQSGNCAVFSGMLAIQSLIGQNRGNDMMQSFKSYNAQSVDDELSKKSKEVRARKAELEKAEETKRQEELAKLTPIDNQVIIYPVSPDKSQCTLAIQFASTEIKTLFKNRIIEFAKQRDVNLNSIFGDDDNNPNILCIKASNRSYNENENLEDSLGAYVSLNEEVAVHFGSDKIAEEFRKLAGITDQAWVAMKSNTLYFERKKLPPIDRYRILTTLSPLLLSDVEQSTNQNPSAPPILDMPSPGTPEPKNTSLQLLLGCIKPAIIGGIGGAGINLLMFELLSTSASISLVASLTSPMGLGIIVTFALISVGAHLCDQSSASIEPKR